MSEKKEDPADKAHARGKTTVKTREAEVPEPARDPEPAPVQEITIRPEQTPRKRNDAEEADSDRKRGDDLRPGDYDNPIARGDIPDPLQGK